MLKTTIYKIDTKNHVSQPTLKQEGACKNELLIVVRESDLTAENSQTLGQILNAIKYNLEDSCLLKLADSVDTSISLYLNKYNIKRVICFGIAPNDLGLQITAGAYRLIEMEGLKLVFSHKIADLNADKQKKIKLWNVIQGF